jgi:glycosidase
MHVAYDWTEELGAWAWEEAVAATDAAALVHGLREAIEPTIGPPSVLRVLNTNDSGERLVDRIGPERTRLMAALQLTLPGLPLLFAGDEVGASYEPYSERAGVSWDDPHALRPWYAALIALRGDHAALGRGDLAFLDAPEGVLAYQRGEGPDGVVVLLNFGESVSVELPYSAGARELTDLLSGQTVEVRDGIVVVELAPGTASILASDGAD